MFDLIEEIDKLSEHDQDKVKDFIEFIKYKEFNKYKSSLNSVEELTSNKLNSNILYSINPNLPEYLKIDIDYIETTYLLASFYFRNRDRPVSFPVEWFNDAFYDDQCSIKSLYIKFRPGTNKIDKIALPEKYLSELGAVESKKRILIIKAKKAADFVSVPQSVSIPQQTSTAFVKDILEKVEDNKFITCSVAKNDPMFDDLYLFKEDRLRLARVAETLVFFIDSMRNARYQWNSQYFHGCKHDFTDIKPELSGLSTGKTLDVKAHFHKNDRLQLSDYTLKNVDADIILSVLVEETDTSYVGTICGWITKEEFMAKTKPWSYNETVTLRSMEIHELNNPHVLF